ncbi:exocyst complex component EXO70B1-like [Oryza brachyantha]|uniref:exocyst complex component EXO70B1-like n=1 Tax=Oryza brachyantha TaxID=4533 RepID=UPI0003EA8EA6|nr:exocyst complex component EXO70B1-like [Oryza brachyantha]XP_006644940.1 exocyst complex component EXO70B1-like [Oryza brachyantha]
MTSMEDTLQALTDLISQFLCLNRPLWSSSDDADAFLEAVDELTSTIHGLESTSADDILLERFDHLLERCSLRLQDELHHLIDTTDFDASCSYHDTKKSHNDDDSHTLVAQPVSNFDIIVDTLPEGVIFEANRITRRMIAAGFGDSCAETYASSRLNFIDESIARLGVHAHMAEMFKSASWEELETQILRWIPAIRAVFHILIPSERHLCDCIFEGSTSCSDLAFATASQPFLQLLSFGNFIAAAGKNPECLFRIVDMYDALRDILPVLDEAFNPEVSALRECLGSSIKGILMALENLVRRDPSESCPQDGGVHPITRYVMNYLVAACVSRHTLEEVMLLEFGGSDPSTSYPIEPDRPTSSLAVHLAWIVDVLIENLVSKSKVYRHAPLSCVFLVNNGIYIIKKVNGCELKVLLGEDWTKLIYSKVNQWILEYRRATWGKAVTILEMDKRLCNNVNAMTEKLNRFNNFVEAICQVQSRWVLVDKQQAVDFSILVEELVIPAYTDIIEMLKATRSSGESYMQPEYVRSQIQQLFKSMAR